MYTEEEFFKRIKEATGLDTLQGYGFIAGTHHPITSAKRHVNDDTMPAYIVWKTRPDGTHAQKHVLPEEHSIETIIAFLNDKKA